LSFVAVIPPTRVVHWKLFNQMHAFIGRRLHRRPSNDTPPESKDPVSLQDIPTLSELYADNVPTLSELAAFNKGFSHQETHNNLISVWRGNIARLKVDALVNSCTPRYNSHTGVSNSIFEAAGPQLSEHTAKLPPLLGHEPALTPGFDLPANHVIHICGPFGQNALGLIACYEHILELSKKEEIKTLAFCCISCGGRGYPSVQAAHIALRTTREWLDQNTDHGLERIVFCTYLDQDDRVYQRVLPLYFPSC
jgi:O-acetyl-ADP-ribose deacetylase (regulator of RNase III)